MKILISSFGNLFFKQIAKVLDQVLDVNLAGGFIPNLLEAKIINLVNFLQVKEIERMANRYDPILARISKSSSIVEFLYILHNHIFGKRDISDVFFHKWYGKSSSRFIKNIDIFHVRSGSGQGGAIKKAHRLGIPVIVDHSIAYTPYMENILTDEYKKYEMVSSYNGKSAFWRLVNKDCEEADVLLVNSDFVKQSFVEYGFDEDRIKVLYLGVRKDFIGLKRDYEIKDSCKVLFVGTFGFRKGGEYILQAIDKLSKTSYNLEFIIIGCSKEFDSVIKKYNTVNVKFIPYVKYDDLKNYYMNSDIFLFPSLCEGSARVAMEAMGVGLPVIVTPNTGVPVANNINGLVVDIKDSDMIVSMVLKLYNSKELREKLGKAASIMIKNRYTWDNYRDNLISLYSKLINRNNDGL